eukprot:scaffold122493_cov69-Phaeocystis_antarctica.AAC.1
MWSSDPAHQTHAGPRYAERRGAPESGPGVRLTGVLWSSWSLAAMVGACYGRESFKTRLVRGRSSFKNAPRS